MADLIDPKERPTASPFSTSSGKLFVGGLSPESSKESLEAYFSKFGEILDCVVMYDRESGRSRGFGFITFKETRAVDSVMMTRHRVDNKEIEVKRAVPKDPQQVLSERQMMQSSVRTRKLFVGGLAPDTTEDEMRSHFSAFGQVEDCVIMRETGTEKSRGFGFVTFNSDECVDRSIAATDHIITGKWVEVKPAMPRSALPAPPRRNGRDFDRREDPRDFRRMEPDYRDYRDPYRDPYRVPVGYREDPYMRRDMRPRGYYDEYDRRAPYGRPEPAYDMGGYGPRDGGRMGAPMGYGMPQYDQYRGAGPVQQGMGYSSAMRQPQSAYGSGYDTAASSYPVSSSSSATPAAAYPSAANPTQSYGQMPSAGSRASVPAAGTLPSYGDASANMASSYGTDQTSSGYSSAPGSVYGSGYSQTSSSAGYGGPARSTPADRTYRPY